ncbi:unnamed protein product [Sphagnum compactum]
MAGSNHQLIYAMAPQYAAPLQYQYYTAEQPPLALPYSSLYSPPPPLPYDHQGLVGRIKRPAEDAWGAPDYTKRVRPDSGGVVVGPFPQRPGEKMCAYYMTTRNCSFGTSCRFDHPTWVPVGGIANWKEVTASVTPTDPATLPQRPGETVCAYYMKTGECKYGIKCRFDHPKERPESGSHNDQTQQAVTPVKAAAFNSKGLPIRPSEIDCVYYVKTGSCKYGASCRFNHPEANLAGKVIIPVVVIICNMQLWLFQKQAPFMNSSGQECAYPSGISVVGSYPQRPGEADCSFFLKTGECSFGPTCRFNHPPNRVPSVVSRPSSIAAAASVKLTLAGLPRRESETPCAYYMKTGACKFGPVCKFDHPTPGEVAAKALEAARVEVPVMLDTSLPETSTLGLNDPSVAPSGNDVVETFSSAQEV